MTPVDAPIRVAMVTNIPAPYRVPVYEAAAADPALVFKAFFCAGSEPDRNWSVKPPQYPHVFLKERFLTVGGRFIHFNADVWSELRKFAPDVVVTTGYNPSHLLAFAYAMVFRKAHVVMTDGTARSEAVNLTFLHRWVRRMVFCGTRAYAGACQGSFELLAQYGVAREHMFQSHLCADNAAFAAWPAEPAEYDLLFSGRFVKVKNPLFALDVAAGAAKRLGRPLTLAFMGAGELEPEMRAHASSLAEWVHVTFLGFVQPPDLPRYYKRSRLFLFPTSWDPWGVVANEACAAGLPIIATPEAGAAGEIIHDGVNGFIRPLVLDDWIDAVARLLSDEALYRRMSEASPEQVSQHRYDCAAAGIRDAVRHAMRRPGEKPSPGRTARDEEKRLGP